jgi:hypothetical protein
VQPLLDVVNHSLLKICGIVREQSNARDRLFDRRIMTAADRLAKIRCQQESDTFYIGLGDRAVLLPPPSSLFAL